MGNISGRAVEVNVGGKSVTLDKVYGNNYVLNIEQIREDSQTISSAVLEGINYMKARGGGEIIVPPTSSEDEVRIKVYRNRETHNVEVKFITRNFRNPIENEVRPYTGDVWEVGDFVMGIEHSGTITFGWLCVEGGSPGVWREIG